jgi:hypothetical protein
MRPVLVGIDPGPGKAGVPPLDAGYASGGRIAALCGLSGGQYHDRFDRVNLYPHPDVPPEHDLEAGVNLLPILRGRRVVTLGDRVSRVLGVTGLFDWAVRPGGFVGAAMPHPAGRNRWWNAPEHTRNAKGFLRSLLKPSVHIEGPDGAGKTTLYEVLKGHLGEGVPTDDPPADQSECMRRVQARVRPGVVCDRSSGLISELVYGPVLRGGTLGPEDTYWDVVRAVIHAVVFVYCRPRKVPVESLRFRGGEDRSHVQGVKEKYGELVERYDHVMSRVSALGGRVIRYNWERDNPSEVMECVG